MAIAIFIHAAAIGRYKNRLLQYLKQFKDSGLYDAVTLIHICYLGPLGDASIFDGYDKIICQQVSDNLADYELHAHSALYRFCKTHPNYKVLYLHTKGVHLDINPCVEDWVSYMTYFCINKWRECIEKLDSYKTAGVDLRSYPLLHYSGNFWWARADHISTLPDPADFINLNKYPNPLNSVRHNQEFWLAHNTPYSIHYCMWESHINCFERHLHLYPKSAYTTEI